MKQSGARKRADGKAAGKAARRKNGRKRTGWKRAPLSTRGARTASQKAGAARESNKKTLYDIGYDAGYEKGYADHLAHSRQEVESLTGELAERSRSAEGKAFDKGFDQGHDLGYQKGYNLGFDTAADMFYARGLYEGGDKWIDEQLPPDIILPDATVREVIAEGLQRMQDRWIRLLSPAEVAAFLREALEARRPFSVVRLGDGELLTLSQETVLPADEVRRRGDFLGYAGVDVPDLAARDTLAASIGRASIVGVPKQRLRNFQPLLVPALNAVGLDHRSMRLTYSIINYGLFYEGHLRPLLEGRNVLVVGNHAESLAEAMGRQLAATIRAVSPVQGMKDVDRVIESIRPLDFDIALVSAGVAAVPITERIATEMGRVALDFGHLADLLISGQAVWT